MDVLFSAGSAKETALLSEDAIKDIALCEVIDHMGGDPDEK